MAIKYALFGVALVVSSMTAATNKHSHAIRSKPHTIMMDSTKRDYLLYRPASAKRQSAVPLVIVLHGGFGSAKEAEQHYDWDSQADSSGFIVAYPNGIHHSWNAGGTCCGPAVKNNVDDVAFITQVIDDISHT
jgi:polyhydroxybutyrate depolymerase